MLPKVFPPGLKVPPLASWVTAASAILLVIAPLHAHPDDTVAWRLKRDADFAAFHGSHPDQSAMIAHVEVATRRLVGKLGNAPTAAAPIPTATKAVSSAMSGAPDATLIWRVTPGVTTIWDGSFAPKMVLVPAGEFTMGSDEREPDRSAEEQPAHRVRVAYALAVSEYPVTVHEFAQFAKEAGFEGGKDCYLYVPGKGNVSGFDWRHPGYSQTGDDPAVCISFNDAQAYAAWLSRKTGQSYRLLSESEYEYINRAGSTTTFSWGDDPAKACDYANGPDLDFQHNYPGFKVSPCHDGYAFTSPVGRFKPNGFGLYDTTGDVWSWTADCWTEQRGGGPVDGSPETRGDCSLRVLRGGSWSHNPAALRAAFRGKHAASDRSAYFGIRLARNLATRERP